jgi:hypothetical protein
MSKNDAKYQYNENKLETSGEVTSRTSGVLIISRKACNVKCNVSILEELNANIRRPIMNEDRNDPTDINLVHYWLLC